MDQSDDEFLMEDDDFSEGHDQLEELLEELLMELKDFREWWKQVSAKVTLPQQPPTSSGRSTLLQSQSLQIKPEESKTK